MIRKMVLICIIALTGTGILLLPVQSGFLVSDGKGKLYNFFSDRTNEVSIGWRHSVELTPWKETYRVLNDGELTLLSTTYKSYGAGTPDREGNAEILPEGFIKVTGINRTIPYYSLFYIPISQYTIELNGKQYQLSEFVPEYENVQIRYGTIRLHEWVGLKMNNFNAKGGMKTE